MKSFLIILFFAAVLKASTTESPDSCKRYLILPSTFEESKRIFTNEQLQNCSRANMIWSNPMNNLTFVFSAPQSKPFRLSLFNTIPYFYDIPTYHVINGKEEEIKKSTNKVVLKRDSTNSLTLKFVGPSKSKYFGVYIDHSITV